MTVKNKQNQEYFIGLDIGTNSVGWSVTDTEYNILKLKGKKMWGVRKFDSAQTAKQTRLFRSSRRRLDRRKKRIDWLQEIFAEEICKVDPAFFIRMNESRLHLEDKTEKYKHPLFNDENYKDNDYYREFPTIYHLRNKLMNNTDKHDIRLVYLALHHIIKKRGHFLLEGNIEIGNVFHEQLMKTVDFFIKHYLGYDESAERQFNFDEYKRVVSKKVIDNDTKKYLKKLFKDIVVGNEYDQIISEFNMFVLGRKVDFDKLFQLEKDTIGKVEVYSNAFDEKLSIVEDLDEKHYTMMVLAKSLSDIRKLKDVMRDKKTISAAKIESYNIHNRNLKSLKVLVSKYLGRERYNQFFKDDKKGYALYISKYNVKKADSAKELKTLLDDLEKLKIQDEDDKNLIQDLVAKLNLGIEEVLPLQNSIENALFPQQLNYQELVSILNNASKHYPFLENVCVNGNTEITNSQKVEEIFKYHIPFYIGPLIAANKNEQLSKFSWLTRKEPGAILPWNIEDKVDFEKTNQDFILRMTNKCSYLIGEDVLPKNSLLYSKFSVLNEINKIKVFGRPIDVKTKQKIFNNVFCQRVEVKIGHIKNELKQAFQQSDFDVKDITGINEDKINSNLKSFNDFKRILKDNFSDEKYVIAVEKIIFLLTIYGQEKKIVKKFIDENYKELFTDDQIKSIIKLNYKGWGRLSKKLLTGIEGTNLETGEKGNIIHFLWEDDKNYNLMELLSGRFDFRERIDEVNDPHSTIYEMTYENLVSNLYVSPIAKRPIWQATLICEEITKVMGYAPSKFFVEMARGLDGEAKNKPRKDVLLALYKDAAENSKELYSILTKEEFSHVREKLNKESNDRLKSKKLFLYYLQLGKSMYTGKTIKITDLYNTSCWNIDHIIPQSYYPGNSLDNIVLVESDKNKTKNQDPVSPEIRKNQKGFWDYLLKKNLISKVKYSRLNKAEYSKEDLTGFIERQLVTTRQSTKIVTQLLEKIYPDSRVVYVKANNVSRFRQQELGYLKSRMVNDYHHAKDAYLNVVVGNVYDEKFTKNFYKWISQKLEKQERGFVNFNKMFEYDVKSGDKIIWEACQKDNESNTYFGGTLEKIRTIVHRNDVLYTEMTYVNNGEFFNQNADKKEENLFPLKKGLNPAKYGGYKGINKSYFVMFEYLKNDQWIKSIRGIPTYLVTGRPVSDDVVVNYLKSLYNFDIRILIPKIKINSLFYFNGFPIRLRGDNGINLAFKASCQLVLSLELEETLRMVEKAQIAFASTSVENENESSESPAIDNKKFELLTNERLNQLYDVLLNKLETIYAERFSSPIETVKKFQQSFHDNDDRVDKILILFNLINVFRCTNESSTDLRGVGLSKRSGRMSKNINAFFDNNHVEIVHQSVTGLFVRKKKL